MSDIDVTQLLSAVVPDTLSVGRIRQLIEDFELSVRQAADNQHDSREEIKELSEMLGFAASTLVAIIEQQNLKIASNVVKSRNALLEGLGLKQPSEDEIKSEAETQTEAHRPVQTTKLPFDTYEQRRELAFKYESRLNKRQCLYLPTSRHNYCGNRNFFNQRTLLHKSPITVTDCSGQEVVLEQQGSISIGGVNGVLFFLDNVWYFPGLCGIVLGDSILSNETFEITRDGSGLEVAISPKYFDEQLKLHYLWIEKPYLPEDKPPKTYFEVEVEGPDTFVDFSRTFVYASNDEFQPDDPEEPLEGDEIEYESETEKEYNPLSPHEYVEFGTSYDSEFPEDIERTHLQIYHHFDGTPEQQREKVLICEERLRKGQCLLMSEGDFHYCGVWDRFDKGSLVNMPVLLAVEGDEATFVRYQGTITLNVINGKPVVLKNVWFYPKFKGIGLSPALFFNDPQFSLTIGTQQWEVSLKQSDEEIRTKTPKTCFVVEIEESRVFIDFSRTYLLDPADS